MNVASASHRTLWQNTVGKDFSDPSSIRSLEAPHTADSNVPLEVCLTSDLDSSIERNPLESGNLFRASNRHRGPFSKAKFWLVANHGIARLRRTGLKPFSLYDS